MQLTDLHWDIDNSNSFSPQIKISFSPSSISVDSNPFDAFSQQPPFAAFDGIHGRTHRPIFQSIETPVSGWQEVREWNVNLFLKLGDILTTAVYLTS